MVRSGGDAVTEAALDQLCVNTLRTAPLGQLQTRDGFAPDHLVAPATAQLSKRRS